MKKKFTLKEAKEEIIHISKTNQMLSGAVSDHSHQITNLFEMLVGVYKSINADKEKTVSRLKFPDMWKKYPKPD